MPERAGANESKCGGRGEMAGRSGGEVRVNRAHGNGARWTGSPKSENAGVIRVNYFCPGGLDAIRDSRIASQDGFRDTPASRSASEVRSRCVSTKTASLARTEKSLAKRGSVEITDLEANTARVGARSSCATRLCANRNRKSH